MKSVLDVICCRVASNRVAHSCAVSFMKYVYIITIIIIIRKL